MCPYDTSTTCKYCLISLFHGYLFCTWVRLSVTYFHYFYLQYRTCVTEKPCRDVLKFAKVLVKKNITSINTTKKPKCWSESQIRQKDGIE